MSPRVAVTLSCGDNGAFAAHVGPNPSRVEQNTSDAARRQINRSASHHHIYGRFGAAISNEAARRIVGERNHPIVGPVIKAMVLGDASIEKKTSSKAKAKNLICILGEKGKVLLAVFSDQ
jgi:hypothetical protein